MVSQDLMCPKQLACFREGDAPTIRIRRPLIDASHQAVEAAGLEIGLAKQPCLGLLHVDTRRRRRWTKCCPKVLLLAAVPAPVSALDGLAASGLSSQVVNDCLRLCRQSTFVPSAFIMGCSSCPLDSDTWHTVHHANPVEDAGHRVKPFVNSLALHCLHFHNVTNVRLQGEDQALANCPPVGRPCTLQSPQLQSQRARTAPSPLLPSPRH